MIQTTFGSDKSINIPSLHIFGDADTIVPSSESINVMSMYQFPSMKIRSGGHEVPNEEESTKLIIDCLGAIYTNQFDALKLED